MNSISYKNYPILVVDDEPNNLQSFLAILENEFNADGVGSGLEALEKLKSKNYAVVVSDEKMYPMSGVQLLTQVAQCYPDIMRIVITGYADYDAAINAINEAQAFRYIFKSSQVTRDLKSTVKQALGYYWDREERKRLQKMLMRENRLSALGKLAYALSHEMNNPLVSLSTFVQLLPEKYDDPQFRDTFCKLIKDDVARIEKIVKSISKFSDAQNSEMRDVNLRDFIEETCLFFGKSEEAQKIRLDNKAVQSHVVMANRYLLVQVLLNLLMNSAQAMKDGSEGKVEISTEPDSIILKDRDGVDRHFVRLIVKDNGPGIEENILENIFDPFVTTHNTGNTNRRPGLGLFVSQLIVEAHHGYIDIQSKIGQGTTVVVDLPLHS